MNRWQAIVEIIKSFNDRGATSYAFAALCIFVIVPLLALLVLALNVEWPHLWLPRFGPG
jgi:hypothetical protein